MYPMISRPPHLHYQLCGAYEAGGEPSGGCQGLCPYSGYKSQRLKSMVQDVFEISKAASKQLPVNLEDLDLGKLLRQTLADMEEQIEESSVTVKAQIPAEAVMIHADGSRLYRVFQNLLQTP